MMHPEDKKDIRTAPEGDGTQEQTRKTDSPEEVGQSNAAKVLRALEKDGGQDEPPVYAQGSRLSNFWYHHKWKVILTAFFGFVFIVLTTQFMAKSSPDITLLYAGPYYVTPNESQAFTACVTGLIDDYNGDGEKKVLLHDMVFLTPKQIEEAESRGDTVTLNRQTNSQIAEQFTYEIMAGESLLCFLAPEQFAQIAAVEAWVPLEEIFGYEPEGAVDGCGLRLSETKFYKYYGQARIFGEDIIIALRKLTTFDRFLGEKEALEAQGWYKDLFCRIGTFEYPEGYVEPEQNQNS